MGEENGVVGERYGVGRGEGEKGAVERGADAVGGIGGVVGGGEELVGF